MKKLIKGKINDIILYIPNKLFVFQLGEKMLSRTRQRQYDNIINNAKSMFIAKGINDTSMNDIAQQAGIERKNNI